MELPLLRKYCTHLIISSGSGITLSEKSSSPARVSNCPELSWAYPELWKTLSPFGFSHPLLTQSSSWAFVVLLLLEYLTFPPDPDLTLSLYRSPSPVCVSHFPSWPWPYPELVLSSQSCLCISLSLLPGICGATSPAWVFHCLPWSWAYPELV